MVINHLVKLTQDLTEFKQEMTEFKQEMIEFKQDTTGRLGNIESEIKELKESQQRTEARLELVYNHTAQLTEDLTIIKKETEFHNYKIGQNERDIYQLKKAIAS
jgi:chromosome segregation ATPase